MTLSTIHIIDDEPAIADMLGEFVLLLGYEANIYTQAKQFFENEHHDLKDAILILDLIMPEMDGIEVMRRLAQAGNAPSLILISGYDQGVLHSAEQLAQMHSLNILATLSKPLQFNELQDILQKYAQNHKRQAVYSNRDELQLTDGELEDAILEQQLILHYQPQIDIKKGTLIGVETLVRWQHPEYGLIYPNLFIPLAQKSGLIGDLTAQIIQQAVKQVVYWQATGFTPQISINLSADNIKSLALPEQLDRLLQNNQLDSSLFILEITESALMAELATSLDILTRLRMKGIQLSIDDFGTGYSSLSQLYRIPFTELKIDLSFVMNMTQDDEARGIVKTCIILGHELKMKVVAEGVEDQETLNLLNQMGCDIAQGYYIAKPMPADTLLNWNQHRRITP